MRLAYYKTSKGRRLTRSFLQYKEYSEHNLKELSERLRNGTYKPGTPNEFWVTEPKVRMITALPFEDRIVQHALCNIIEPIFDKSFLPRSYACRNGKGTHSGVVDLQAELRRMNKIGQVYCLKTDFSKYFSSIDRSVLNLQIKQKISCKATLNLIETIVPPEGVGLVIGSLTSQLFANVYGNALDRFIQQELRVSSWYRYMDDVVILSHDLEHIHELYEKIKDFSHNGLKLKFSKWSISSVNRGVNFLGYRIWDTHKLLRKQSVTRAKRKIKILRDRNLIEDLDKFKGAWQGHAQWADSHNLLTYLGLV